MQIWINVCEFFFYIFGWYVRKLERHSYAGKNEVAKIENNHTFRMLVGFKVSLHYRCMEKCKT